MNARGFASAEAIGAWLQKNHYWPDDVLCSSAKRTVQTCANLGFSEGISYHRDLYHASPEAMMGVLQKAIGETVALISHNPGIAEFAYQRAGTPPTHPRFMAYPTCATSVFEFDIEDWTEASPNTASLTDFIVPRDLI